MGKCKDNITMDVTWTGRDVDYNHLAQDSDQGRTPVLSAINLQVPNVLRISWLAEYKLMDSAQLRLIFMR